MPPAHAAVAITVGELLGGSRLFGVPQYQRPYAWRKRQADQLLTDLFQELDAIEASADKDRNYYLGLAVVIDITPPRRAMRPFARGSKATSEIVDGKQRLTTLTMLIAVLRDLLGAEGTGLETYLTETGKSRNWPAGTSRLMIEGHEQDFLAKHVLPPGATAKRVPKDHLHESTRRMREVRDYLYRELKGVPAARLLRFAGMLLNRCELTVIVPKDIAGGYRTFVSVNFRGKPLSTTDIVKADLFGQIEPAERRKLNERWLALAGRLEPHPDNDAEAKRAASFDNLLSYVHKLRARPGTGIFQGIAELASTAGDPKAFITDVLEPMGDHMLALTRASHTGSSASPGINRVLTTLNWLPASDWVPVAMAALHAHPRRPDDVLRILGLLQRLAYGCLILGKGGPARETRYRDVLKAIAEGRSLADHSHPLMLTDDEDDGIARGLANGLYRARSSQCRPVLAWISAIGTGAELPARLDDVTVEHILPQTAADHAYWRKHFPEPRVREAATRSLGNLTLITKRQNDRCKNAPYPEKIAILSEGGAASPFEITRMLLDIAEWTPEAVLQRETILFERVATAWGLKSKGRSKLAQLLKP